MRVFLLSPTPAWILHVQSLLLRKQWVVSSATSPSDFFDAGRESQTDVLILQGWAEAKVRPSLQALHDARSGCGVIWLHDAPVVTFAHCYAVADHCGAWPMPDDELIAIASAVFARLRRLQWR